MSSDAPQSRLDMISTRWGAVGDPVQFALRYAPAIQRYLSVLIANPQDAEEVTQDFLLRMVQHGFPGENVIRGRFRDYLIAAVRNAARGHFRRKQMPTHAGGDLGELPAAEVGPTPAEQAWLDSWRRSLLDRVWEALESHQQTTPDNLFFTSLRVAVDYPDEDSRTQAERVSTQCGRPIRADAYRKQVSRARRKFAELLLAEVAQTLSDPCPHAIQDELVDLGLLPYVRNYLPANWADQTSGRAEPPKS